MHVFFLPPTQTPVVWLLPSHPFLTASCLLYCYCSTWNWKLGVCWSSEKKIFGKEKQNKPSFPNNYLKESPSPEARIRKYTQKSLHSCRNAGESGPACVWFSSESKSIKALERATHRPVVCVVWPRTNNSCCLQLEDDLRHGVIPADRFVVPHVESHDDYVPPFVPPRTRTPLSVSTFALPSEQSQRGAALTGQVRLPWWRWLMGDAWFEILVSTDPSNFFSSIANPCQPPHLKPPICERVGWHTKCRSSNIRGK